MKGYITMSEETIEQISESEVLTPEEAGEMVWHELLAWVNGSSSLSAHVKELFVERSKELRLRMQAVFLEMQRKFILQAASDIEFEGEIRRSIKAGLPYMSYKEKTDALNVLVSTGENRFKRLESQLAGWDFFNTIEVSMQSLSEANIPRVIKAAVGAMPSEKRQQLLATLTDIVKEADKKETNEQPIPI
jgi:hypothetical protein